MKARPLARQVPDFSAFPDLVVMMLGMQVRTLVGIRTLLGYGPAIDRAAASRPEGLLHAENGIIFGFRPFHVGMRWYWRDATALEAWARSEPHRIWWTNYLRESGGTAIWHETYHMRGGMEAIYADPGNPVGFANFMPMVPARGTMASRHRAAMSNDLGGLPVENLPGP